MDEIKYFKNDDMAAHAWRDKYALPDEKSPDDMHQRLAKEFARIEEKYPNSLSYDKIYNMFKDFKYIVPQGSVMSMLGNPKIGSLSNCFVIGQPEDSYGGILQKDQELVQLMKRRGGVGLDISTLRPEGIKVNNAAKTSTGAVSFMERFSNSTREVAQGGRRGALMLTIDVRHPDVLGFINSKKDRTKVTGANISVMLRDDFMDAVNKNEDYILRWPCNKVQFNNVDYYDCPYNTLYTDGIGYYKKVKAKEIYDAIVENAWENAEPGQMFVDRHWNYSPDGVYTQYRGVTTNPCGEIFMQAYDACRLIALNLFSFVKNPFTDKAEVDYEKLWYYAYCQQKLADDLVDLELEHIDRIINKVKQDPQDEFIKATEIALWENIRDVAASSRRTGSGFTALGDMLAALGVKYDSEESFAIIQKVMKTKMDAELLANIHMAKQRGTFKGWDDTLEFEWYTEDNGDGKATRKVQGKNGFYQMLVEEFPERVQQMCKYGRRNVSWSTVAPTGTLSLMTQTTSGLEPLFMPYYIRRKKINPDNKGVRVDFVDQNGDSWQEYPILHPKFKDWINNISGFSIDSEGILHSEAYKDELLKHGNEYFLNELFIESPWYDSTANDINWIERVNIQGIIQKYTSHSISSTINLPNNVTQDEVAKIYMTAYEAGLKGVTIYRDGSRTGVLISGEDKGVFKQHDAPKRPEQLACDIHHLTALGKRWTVLVGLYDDKPYEVFTVEGTIAGKYESGTLSKKEGGVYNLTVSQDEDVTVYANVTEDMTDEQAALTRLVSTGLRHGVNVQYIVEQLNKADGLIISFTKAIARTLTKYVSENELLNRATCQDCGSTNLRMEEGCVKCNDCGSSKCG